MLNSSEIQMYACVDDLNNCKLVCTLCVNGHLFLKFKYKKLCVITLILYYSLPDDKKMNKLTYCKYFSI